MMTEIFGSFAVVAAATVAISEGIINRCKVEKGWAKQLISWGTAIVLSIVGFLSGIGIFGELGPINQWQGWVMTALTGLGLGLVANGLYDVKSVQTLLQLIKDFIYQFINRIKPTKVEEVDSYCAADVYKNETYTISCDCSTDKDKESVNIISMGNPVPKTEDVPETVNPVKAPKKRIPKPKKQ